MSDTNTSVQPVVAQEKKSNTGKILIGCCLVLLVVICMCCGALVLLFGATASTAVTALGQVQESLGKVCDGRETDLRSFYDNHTSKSFRNITSYSEFKGFFQNYKEIILDCTQIKSGTFFNNKINGLQVNVETVNGVQTLNIQYPSGTNTVFVQFVEESSQWKVNTIEVK